MHPILPSEIASYHRPLTNNEVRAESFGVLKAASLHSATDWEMQRGTFDDQAIFGPRRRYACACGQYRGSRFAHVVCHRCGVPLTTPEVRRTRCAHIELNAEVAHPLGDDADRLDVIPVLPVAFVESTSGAELLAAYNMIIRAEHPADVLKGFLRLLEVLAPAVVMAHRWDLTDRRLLAHGMALTDRD